MRWSPHNDISAHGEETPERLLPSLSPPREDIARKRSFTRN